MRLREVPDAVPAAVIAELRPVVFILPEPALPRVIVAEVLLVPVPRVLL